MSRSASNNPATITSLDSNFNAVLLEAFLCGLYTLLFAYTLHILLRKPNKKAYATVLTFLWIFVMVTFAFDWQYHRTAFVSDSDSPVDMNNRLIGNTGVASLEILENVFSIACFWLADALLIWRCYVLWEGKRWVLLPLPILFIAAVVLGTLYNIPQISNVGGVDVSIFLVSFFAVSIAITLMGTSMIILRILLVTRSSPLVNDTRRYRKILRILMESGILYTIATIVCGVTIMIQLTANEFDSISLNELKVYIRTIAAPLSGIGTTLIAARVAHEPAMQTDTSASKIWSGSRALSRLTFKRSLKRNDTIDIEDGLWGCSYDPTNSCIGQGVHEGYVEKMAVHNLGITM